MPKVTGISIGRADVRVVEVEGTSRRFRVLRAFVQPLESVQGGPAEPVPALQEMGRALNQTLKDQGVTRDSVAMVFPGRDCLVRNAQVSLKGEDSIRKVIKYEAEGFFQSADIDQLVVDFLSVRETSDGSEIMVAAAPKATLRELLEKARLGGIDPALIDLDSVALFRCAQTVGLVDPESDQVLVDLGLHSSRLLVVREGKLAGLRSLRFGLASFGFRLPQISEEKEEAKEEEEEDQGDGSRDEGGGEAVQGLAPEDSFADRVEPGGADAFATRIGREVARFLTSFGPGFRAGRLLVCGPGAGIESVRLGLADRLGLEVVQMNPLERMEHSLPAEEAARIGPALLPAMGVALELLGAAQPGMDFRRDEFAFTRRFERIRFPLAVALMFLAFLLFIQYFRFAQERDLYTRWYGTPADSPTQALLVPQVWVRFIQPLNLPETLRRELRTDRIDPMDRIPYWRTQLSAFKRREEDRLGYFPDLPPLESGLHVLRAFAWYMEQLRQQVSGKMLVSAIELRMDSPRLRYLNFDLILWGEGRRGDFDELRRYLNEICKEPNSPFASFEPAGKEDLTNPRGGSKYNRNRLVLKPEVSMVENWPPAGA